MGAVRGDGETGRRKHFSGDAPLGRRLPRPTPVGTRDWFDRRCPVLSAAANGQRRERVGNEEQRRYVRLDPMDIGMEVDLAVAAVRFFWDTHH